MNERKKYFTVVSFLIFLYYWTLPKPEPKHKELQNTLFTVWNGIRKPDGAKYRSTTFHKLQLWYFTNQYAVNEDIYQISTYVNNAGGEIGFVETMYAIMQKSNKNNIVIDAGMNIGFFSLLASSMGFTVHSYEVNPNCVSYATGLIDINGLSNMVTMVKAGLGGRRQRVSIPEVTGCGGGTQVKHSENLRANNQIDLLPLDELYFYSNTYVLFLKIDIEGEEFNTLRGASLMLKDKRIKHIFMEFQPSVYRNDWDYLEEGLHFILNNGYTIYQTYTWTGCNEFDGLEPVWPHPLGIPGPDLEEDWTTRVHQGDNAGKLHKLVDVKKYLQSFKDYGKAAGSNLWITEY